MKTTLRKSTSRFLCFLSVASFFAAGNAGVLRAQTPDTWNGGTDNWSNGNLWSAGVPDSTSAQVFIDGGKTGTASAVNVDGTRTVGALTLDAGDSLTVPENVYFIVQGGTFAGSGTLTLNGTLYLSGGFRGTNLVFTSPGALTGTGSIDLTTGSNTIRVNTSGDRLTIGANLAIAGGGNLGNGETVFTNAGLIDANLSGNTLDIQPGGGTGDFTNTASGVLEASGGGTLYLDGRGGGTILGGRIQALDGGSVTLDSGIIVDGATFGVAGSGTVNVTGTSTVRAAVITGTFGVNENTYLVVAERASDSSATLTNNGTLALNGGFRGTSLYFSSPGSLTGTGLVTLTGSSQIFAGNSGDRITIGAGQTIRPAGSLGVGQTTFTNSGTVDADGSGNTLSIDPGGGTADFTNTASGVLEATNGATLLLSGGGSGTVAGGIITAFDGSQVVLGSGVILSGATLATSGSGVATVAGSDHATLANVTNTGLLQVPENSSAVFTGTLTNSGTFQLNGGFRGTTLAATGPAALVGPGTTTLTSSSTIRANTAGDRVTIGAGQTILNAGNLGIGQTTFTNNGTVNANLSGSTLTLQPGGGTGDFTNSISGVLEASSGGTLYLNGGSNAFTNNGVLAAQAGSTVSVTSGALANLAAQTLTGGTYEAVADNSTSTAATLDFSGATFTINAATITLSGTNSVFTAVSGLNDNQGTFSLLALRQFTTAAGLSNEGTLTLDAGATLHVAGAYVGSSTATLDFLIGGSASQGAQSPGLLQVNGTGALAGVLAAGFSPGAVLPAASAALTVVSSNASLTGSFANVPDGGRLGVANGAGSFQVNYGATSAFTPATVVLSNYTPPGAPEITSATRLMGKSGNPFSYQTTASNTPTSFAAQGLPAGLSLDPGTGLIMGTPAAAGTFTFVLTAVNAAGTGSATVSLVVTPGPPAITSPTTASGKVGVTFSYQIAATNNPTGYTAQGLPGGLTLNSSTGLIAGTPSTAGTFTLTLTATNASGTGMATLTLTILPPAPVVTSPTTATGKVGTAFSYQITASTTPTSFAAQGLPGGLGVDPGSGLISGTPTAAGNFPVTLTATNAGGTGMTTITLTIQPPAPAITSPTTASGKVGFTFSYQIAATNNPTSYTAQGLPGGLTINPSTGLIAGTPSTPGTSAVTLTATNTGGTGQATLTLTILPAAPVITSPTTASGMTGTAFSYQITASNTPTSFATQGLPGGLSVNASTGLFAGTPTAAGNFPVTLTATNAGGTGMTTLTLTIRPPAPVINSATTANGTVGKTFSYQITASSAPTSYVAQGLPGGLGFDPGSGLISGTPTAAGTFSVTLTATNAGGTGSTTLTLTIQQPAPVVTSPATASGTVGTAFSYQIVATNNPTSYSVAGLPGGLIYNPSTGLISGTPTTAGTSTLTLTATNSGGTGSATLTLTIVSAPIVVAVPVITSTLTASGSVPDPFPQTFSYTITATNSPTSFSARGLPGGLTCYASGLITGSPTTAGVFPVTISATNASGTGSATLTLTVAAGPVPVITSPLTASAQTAGVFVGTFNYLITATNSPTSFGAQGLPGGLTCNATSGVISGTPTTVGTYAVTLTATNGAGVGSATLTLTVTSGGTEGILPTTFASATTGTAFSYQLTATNHPTSYVVQGLPGGLSVNTATGLITGTFATIGTYPVSFNAYDATGGFEQGSLTVTVTQGPAAAGTPVITSLVIAPSQVGIPFIYQITATNSPTAYTVSGLPGGITFNASTGLVSGTPTAAGTFRLAVTASNARGTGAATSFSLTVSPAAPPVITSATTDAVTAGASFYYQITATGNPLTYTAAPLPAGLALKGAVIYGTPTTIGKFPVTLSAANTFGLSKATLTLTISPLGLPVLTSATTATATVSAPFTYQITATNSPTGYGASSLPTGLALNATTGVISGTLPTAGTFTIPITAGNATGKGKSTLILTAVIGRNFTSSRTLTATVGKAFSYRITATGGPTSYDAQGFPAGISINRSTGVISGTPTAVGNSFPTIEVLYGQDGEAEGVTLTVNPAPGVTIVPGPTKKSARRGGDLSALAAGDSAAFVVTLSDPQPGKVVVSLGISGSAMSGVDYAPIKDTVRFAPGEVSKTIMIRPLNAGSGSSGTSKVALKLQSGSGYTVDTPGKVKVKISGP